MDYSQYPLSGKMYGGSEKKIGILIDNEKYIVKFQKDSMTGLRFNHVSEYLGSHIFALLGFDAQETYLGTYNNQNVVIMKDFLSAGAQFVPFNEVGESSLDVDKEKVQYTYTDIMKMLHANKKLTDVDKTIDVFWDMYIVDALIGNFDRHGMNWGFIKKDNRYSLAPIFDNGSALFPQMNDEEEMLRIINDQKEIDKRVYEFPTSQIKLRGKKTSYYKVINSLQFKQCNTALVRIYNRINMEALYKLIDDLDCITPTHKQFYKEMLQNRDEKILKSSYEKLEGV